MNRNGDTKKEDGDHMNRDETTRTEKKATGTDVQSICTNMETT